MNTQLQKDILNVLKKHGYFVEKVQSLKISGKAGQSMVVCIKYED